MSRFDTDGGQQPTPLLSPAFLGLVDHAFFRCPFASVEDLVTAASSDAPGAGVSEADINGFLDLMAKDHTHKNAAADLKKGKSTTGWIPLAQMDLILLLNWQDGSSICRRKKEPWSSQGQPLKMTTKLERRRKQATTKVAATRSLSDARAAVDYWACC